MQGSMMNRTQIAHLVLGDRVHSMAPHEIDAALGSAAESIRQDVTRRLREMYEEGATASELAWVLKCSEEEALRRVGVDPSEPDVATRREPDADPKHP